MTDRVYKRIELVGTSHDSIEDAINNALQAADTDKDKPCWVEVNEIRGHVIDGKVDHYQTAVTVGVGQK